MKKEKTFVIINPEEFIQEFEKRIEEKISSKNKEEILIK